MTTSNTIKNIFIKHGLGITDITEETVAGLGTTPGGPKAAQAEILAIGGIEDLIVGCCGSILTADWGVTGERLLYAAEEGDVYDYHEEN